MIIYKFIIVFYLGFTLHTYRCSVILSMEVRLVLIIYPDSICWKVSWSLAPAHAGPVVSPGRWIVSSFIMTPHSLP